MRKLKPGLESKLSKTVAKIAQNELSEKAGFISTKSENTALTKIKSFRLRPPDFANLSQLVKEINQLSERKTYTESEVIRGVINYINENLDAHMKKLIVYIRNSS
jgi:hypothetical protein